MFPHCRLEKTDGQDDKLSPWEVAPKDSSLVSETERPRLSDVEKRQVRDTLTHVWSIEDVEEFLVYPVNTARYTDVSLASMAANTNSF